MNGIHLDDLLATAADAPDRVGDGTVRGTDQDRCVRAVRDALRHAQEANDAHAAVALLDRMLCEAEEATR
ncbi:hypothetical protein SUDANB121_02995 [Nocardiopsis dassonvillei]|uniref:hypothetical protein n=1 Tax=Nocardiopsis dassonvillei TaxID=2014 RepID=UPI003F5670E6